METIKGLNETETIIYNHFAKGKLSPHDFYEKIGGFNSKISYAPVKNYKTEQIKDAIELLSKIIEKFLKEPYPVYDIRKCDLKICFDYYLIYLKENKRERRKFYKDAWNLLEREFCNG